MSSPNIHLYSWCRSSCSGRLRVALQLKDLPYELTSVNLLNGDQKKPEYLALNPSGTVPTLIHTLDSGEKVTIGQSHAALEYLEDVFPSHPLLPSDPAKRAYVRTLCQILVADVQPLTNLTTHLKIQAIGGEALATTWAKDFMEKGFAVFEKLAEKSAGRFTFGDEITLADVCLIPAAWGYQRIGQNLEKYPTMKRVFDELEKLEAVKKAHWARQPETPEELRLKD